MSKLLTSLHELLPESRLMIRDAFHLTADAVLDCLKAAGVERPLTRIEEVDPGCAGDDDDAIAEVVFSNHWAFHHGTLLVHAPACWRHDLPDFACPAAGLREFIENYQLEMLFDGDVIFRAAASMTLTLFHHEGAFGHFLLAPASAPAH